MKADAAPIRWKHALIALACFAAFLGSLSTGAAWWMARGFTRRPHPPFYEPLPTSLAAHVQTTRVRTADGEQIGLWHAPGESSRPSVLLLHGHRESRSTLADQLLWLIQRGYGAAAPSFRAHGDSTGEVDDIGWSGRLDVVAVVDWLERAQPGRTRIVSGFSMGAAAAIFSADQVNGQVHGYLLEAPYWDLEHAARQRLAIYLPAGFDRVAFAALRLIRPSPGPTDVAEISPYRHVTRIPETTPVTFVSQRGDRRAPTADVRAIQSRIPRQSRLEVIAGGRHDHLFRSDPREYARVLEELVQRASGF